jgi:hypothetical protein
VDLIVPAVLGVFVIVSAAGVGARGRAERAHAARVARGRALAQATTPARARCARTASPVRRGGLSPAAEWERLARAGWHRALGSGGLVVVAGPVPDPGNPGHTLTLAEHSGGALGPTRVLLATNPAAPTAPTGPAGAVGGVVALAVPAHVGDPVQAVAWTYDDPTHPLRTTAGTIHALTRRT